MISTTWRVVLLLAIGTVCCVDAKWWNDEGFYRLEVNEKCNDNGSVTLEFPTIGDDWLYIYALTEDSEFWSKIDCGQSVDITSNNPLVLNRECQISVDQFRLRIFKWQKFTDFIAINSTLIAKYYNYNVDCSDKKAPKVSVKRDIDPNNTPVSFPKTFSIGNQNFTTKTTFNGVEINNGNLGDDVKIEIQIPDKNLFGNESHFTNCQLDQYYGGTNHPDTILEKSCPISDYDHIEFKSRYTRGSATEPAKYTLEFKAFAYDVLYPFVFHCQACSNCDPVDCP